MELARRDFAEVMRSKARAMSAISSSVARRAAIPAAMGSITRRISINWSRPTGVPPSENIQLKTSGSSMFQSVLGRIRVPVLRRTSTKPFAERTFIASRRAVRLTPIFLQRVVSFGRTLSAGKRPDPMSEPNCCVTSRCRLVLGADSLMRA